MARPRYSEGMETTTTRRRRGRRGTEELRTTVEVPAVTVAEMVYGAGGSRGKRETMARYELSDGNSKEVVYSFGAAKELAAEWYLYLMDDAKGPEAAERYRDVMYDSGLVERIECARSLVELREAVGELESALARADGHEDRCGHGSYHVSAADAAGLSLTIERLPRR